MPPRKNPDGLTPSARRAAWEADRKAKGYVKRQVLLEAATARRGDDLCAKFGMTFTALITYLLNLPAG